MLITLLALVGCASQYPTSNAADTAADADTGVADTGSDSDTDNDTGSDDSAADSGSDDTSGDSADSGSDTAGDTGSDADTGAVDTAADSGSDSGGTDSGSGCTDADRDGWCAEGGDCNDFASAVNPSATEVADNSVDENCDGVVETTEAADTGDADTGSADTGTADTGSEDSGGTDTGTEDTGSGDTGGADTGTEPTCTDADADGYCVEGGDCNDANAGISPGAIEIADDGIDQDCSGADEVTPETDADGDGYGESEDCDDTDADVYPGAPSMCDPSIDYDCDGLTLYDDPDAASLIYYDDNDGDGYGYGADDAGRGCSSSGTIPAGHARTSDDCDDSDADVNPGASEVLDDGIDQDCDGSDATMAELQDVAMCEGTSQEACVVDVDGDGVLETLLMDDSQWTSSAIYGGDAEIIEYGSCAINGDTVSTNSVGYYVIDFTGLGSCTTQMTLVQSSASYWWQNYTFCTDGSDTQGLCENMGGYNYLLGVEWNRSTGFAI